MLRGGFLFSGVLLDAGNWQQAALAVVGRKPPAVALSGQIMPTCPLYFQ
jgi:hypothetical protein